MPASFVAEARTSCTRCHKRKKRCDRLLPACQNCQTARVRCSFQDTEQGVTASFPLAYVRSLESQLAALHKQLANGGRVAADSRSGLASESASPTCMPAMEVDDQGMDDAPSAVATIAASSVNSDGGSPAMPAREHPQLPPRPSSQRTLHPPPAAPFSPPPPPPPPPQTPSFAQELKSLSLEAAAERHVGSSSGVSFAKLTQMILCRLTPDKADFVFSSDLPATSTAAAATAPLAAGPVEAAGSQHQQASSDSVHGAHAANSTGFGYVGSSGEPQMVDFDSPSDVFGSSALHGLRGSVSVYPLLFGDVFLTDIMEPSTTLASLAWPPPAMRDDGVDDAEHVNLLVDFYFAHSNTLYPLVVRSELMATLRAMQQDSASAAATLSPLALFRMWMVLAIGSTAFSSVSLTEESEPMLYYNKALQYSEQALALNEMAALEVLTLQVSYSFFNQLGPNTWFLVGMAARVAVGFGLHTASTYESLPVDVAEKRKRVFFSIYMMDRVVSIALGRPFALHDDDIDVTPFAAVDDECLTPGGVLPQSTLQPSIMCVPRHILALRQIASRITRQVYASPAARSSHTAQGRQTAAQREAVLAALHQELVDWRRAMPFPLPDIDSRVPHLSSTWYDFNYYTHLASLYRPSPLFPVMDAKRVKILENAAAMAIRHGYSLHQQQRLAYNWLNFLALFTATLSLIYATTAQPDNLVAVLRQTRAIDDLELSIELFGKLSLKFAAARKIRNMISEICARYRDVRGT